MAFSAEVLSAITGSQFIAEFAAHWRPVGKIRNAEDEITTLVKRHLVTECENITKHRLVTQPLATQALVNASIQRRRTLTDLNIEMYGDVELRSDKQDLDITEEYLTAERYSSSGNRQAIDSELTQPEFRKLFTDEADAKLWWIRHHPDKLDAISENGTITDLIRTVRRAEDSKELGDNNDDTLIRVLGEFLNRVNKDELPAWTTAFIHLLRSTGDDDLEQRAQDVQSRQNGETSSKEQQEDDGVESSSLESVINISELSVICRLGFNTLAQIYIRNSASTVKRPPSPRAPDAPGPPAATSTPFPCFWCPARGAKNKGTSSRFSRFFTVPCGLFAQVATVCRTRGKVEALTFSTPVYFTIDGTRNSPL